MFESLLKQIPLLNNRKSVTPITKGFSFDKKYIVELPAKKVLVKLFEREVYERKKAEFVILEKMRELEIPCPEPLAIGMTETEGYMITSYIEGEDGREEIQKYPESVQFQIGVKAGKVLRQIHHLMAPKDVVPWHTRKEIKHANYMKEYFACGVRIKHDERIMKFIDEHLHLMKNRPNVFQHDDFHLGNMIVHNKQFVGVIDFDRFDWGDPIHDFLKIGIFSREDSIPFSIGQIKGYIHGLEPNDDFWQLYSLYLAMCVFSSVVWTVKTIPEQLDDMLNKIYTFLEDHDYFERIKPKWYEE